MSQALLFARMANWEKTKVSLLTCALCVVAATKGVATASQSNGTTRLRMLESTEANIEEGRGRARSLSNASALDSLPEALGRLRPLLVMLSLVDLIKTTWDGRVADRANQTIEE